MTPTSQGMRNPAYPACRLLGEEMRAPEKAGGSPTLRLALTSNCDPDQFLHLSKPPNSKKMG